MASLVKIPLFLLLLCTLWPLAATAQQFDPDEAAAIADEAYNEGLYKTACIHYRKALAQRNNDISLHHRLAEAARHANYYREAANHYLKVSQAPTAYRYPDCDYHLAQMLKSCGSADSAALYFDHFLRNNIGDRRFIESARREMAVCKWILEHSDTDPPVPFVSHPASAYVDKEVAAVNSGSSQSSPCLIDSTTLLFASIREISKPTQHIAMATDYVLQQIYQTTIPTAAATGEPELNTWGLNSKKHHTGNTAYDPRNDAIYFNRCLPDDFSYVPCDIYVSRRVGDRWQKAVPLDGGVNKAGTSSTQPAVGYLDDGRTILYFASDREGGLGGFDIWYTIVEPDGHCSAPVNLGAPVNTPGNEITPHYHQQSAMLFFSSDYHPSYGGYDINFSRGNRDSWSEPVNIGMPFNGPTNDIYFTIGTDQCEADLGGHPACHGWLVSNRNHVSTDSGSATSTCCNDIYRWSLLPRQPKPDTIVPKPPKPKGCDSCNARNLRYAHKLLPLALYFHNDEPDPRTTECSTRQTYFETFNYYMFRRNEYRAALTANATTHTADSISAEIDRFFDGEVAQGRVRLERLCHVLQADMQRGMRVSLTVEGYASRLHTQDYNYNLSKRRISSIVNQLLQYNNGVLARYMTTDSAGGSLLITERPYGSSQAAAPHGDPVYGLDAARQRFIRIVDYQYLDGQAPSSSILAVPDSTLSLGMFRAGTVSDIELHLPHTALEPTSLQHISLGNPWGKSPAPPQVSVRSYTPIEPDHEFIIYLHIDARQASPYPQTIIPLTLQVKGETSTRTIFLQLGIR